MSKLIFITKLGNFEVSNIFLKYLMTLTIGKVLLLGLGLGRKRELRIRDD